MLGESIGDDVMIDCDDEMMTALRRCEWSSGMSKSTKWPTVGSGHPKCGSGMEFWEGEEPEVAYSWLRASKM